MSDALTGLDDIDWAELEHAYGSASDVPELLRALRSDSADERNKAVYELYGNIFHQGSRYQATAPAVPFLAALALDPSVHDRHQIVHLLASIAIGYDETYLPRGIEIEVWRADVERLHTADPDELRRLDPYDPDQALSHATNELAAYDAVRAEVPRLRDLLADPAPELRAAAVYVLAWFPEEAAETLPALRSLLSSETVSVVASGALVSVGLLSGHDLAPLLQERLAGDDPVQRWAAALALARLGNTDTEVIGALAAASVEPPEAEGIAFLDGDARGYASMTLAKLAGQLPPDAVDAVLDGLSRSSEIQAFPMAMAALQLTMGEPQRGTLPPYEELTEPQQRVLRVLAELDEKTWSWVNFQGIVGAWGVPRERAEIRTYVGLPQE